MSFPDKASFDVLIVGAGFAGMYMLHRVRQSGFSARVLEAGSEVGGTWYWNRYPGARCDIESPSYSYSFDESLQQEWRWPDRYSRQPDILRYAQHVASRFDLYRDIEFNCRVEMASFDPDNVQWVVGTEDGSRYCARFCIMATGCLSVPKTPDIRGIEDYAGRLLHTADWPVNAPDFSDDRVGVIGTGSSAIQAIPILAAQAKSLTVFQRTPNYSIPAWNGPLSDEKDASIKARYPDLRKKARDSLAGDFQDENVMTLLDASEAERRQELERRWRMGGFNCQYAFTDATTSPEANEIAAGFVREKIRGRVKDPEVAELLCPRNHPFGTKRLCVDTDYYETYNRKNVRLIDLTRTPVDTITRTGLKTTDEEFVLDSIVLATGFDAMTGALTNIEICGREGRLLREQWSDGAETYLGLMVAGFPNLFLVTGPGSPSVLCNVLLAIEQHVEWIGDCLDWMKRRGDGLIEATREAQTSWTRHVCEEADKTLYPRANSWYMGVNVPGKKQVFMPYIGGFNKYSRRCDKVAVNGYVGFVTTPG